MRPNLNYIKYIDLEYIDLGCIDIYNKEHKYRYESLNRILLINLSGGNMYEV